MNEKSQTGSDAKSDDKLKKDASGNPPPSPISFWPVFISVVFFLGAFLVSFYVPQSVRNTEGQEWSVPLEPEMRRTPSQAALADVKGSEIQKSRLSQQVQDIIGRAEHHWKVMAYFQSNYYTGILLRNILGGLAALSIFLVSRNGWERSHPVLVSFALTTSVCTAFYAAFPLMFKQEENFAKNKALYLNYVALLNEVHTYVATGHYPQGDKQAKGEKPSETSCCTPLAEFVVHVNDEMARVNDIAIAFDPNKGAVYKFSTDK